MIALRSLRGPNPGHFLAALGCLRVLTQLGHDARLRWERAGGWLSPVYEVGLSADDFAGQVVSHLNRVLNGAWLDERLGRALPVAPEILREVYDAASEEDRERLAGLQEIPVRLGSGKLPEETHKTPFSMLGYGRTGLLSTARKLVVTPEHIARLMTDDARVDIGPTLRWDPLSVAPPAAYRGDRSRPVPVMLGAERLGLEALPLYPVMPTTTISSRRQTRGLVTGWGYYAGTGYRPTHARWRWSLWRGSMDLRTAVALQQSPEMQPYDPDLVWCSRVVTDGYWNFAPAAPLPPAEFRAARRNMIKSATADDWEEDR